MMDFKKEFEDKLRYINLNVSENNIEKFNKYMDMTLEWNEKINLTAIKDKKEFILKHFIDSLTIYKYIKKEDKIIDIGTGAGFPGIPISIVTNNEIVLMDSLNKRINFLNQIIDNIKLDNIKTIHSRAEELAHDKQHRERYDIAVSRAVANLSTLVEYMLPFVKKGGKCICMKGTKNIEEIENAYKAIKILGGQIIEINNFKLANTDNERTIIIIEKIDNTSNKFPRKSGIPSKQPIA